jgi:hypothetical protein
MDGATTRDVESLLAPRCLGSVKMDGSKEPLLHSGSAVTRPVSYRAHGIRCKRSEKSALSQAHRGISRVVDLNFANAHNGSAFPIDHAHGTNN